MSGLGLSASDFSDLGSGISDLFGALGSEDAASAYSTAAKIASSNAVVAENSGLISAAQQQRATFQTISGERATTAGAGFNTTSGSAGDLLRSSAQQGALSKQLVLNQAELTTQGYEQQAAAYKGQESAAQTKGIGGLIGGALSIAAML